MWSKQGGDRSEANESRAKGNLGWLCTIVLLWTVVCIVETSLLVKDSNYHRTLDVDSVHVSDVRPLSL